MTTSTETIQAASIARVTDKSGKLLGFIVDGFQVRIRRDSHGHRFYTCTCDASAKYGCAFCEHAQAVVDLCEARKALVSSPAKMEEHAGFNALCKLFQADAAKNTSAKKPACKANAFDKRMAELEQQRDEAKKVGGFCFLAA